MRTYTWILSISVLLNIILTVLLTKTLNSKPTPLAIIQTENNYSERVSGDSEVDNSILNNEVINADQTIDFGPVVAIIDKTEVRLYELLPYINEVIPVDLINHYDSFSEIPEDYLASAIDSYAIDLLFMNMAEKLSITKNARLQAVIKQNERRSIRTAYLSAISPTLVSEVQIKEKYEELVNSLQNKKEYRARHILLASKKEADIISKALTKKEHSFNELAKLFSLDDSTGFKGGDLGYRILGESEVEMEFEQVVSNLKLNTYSKPFKTLQGWHIAVVEDRRDALIMPYKLAAPVILKNLQEIAVKKTAQSLIENANIVLLAR